jgi:hypothetical protein
MIGEAIRKDVDLDDLQALSLMPTSLPRRINLNSRGPVPVQAWFLVTWLVVKR